MAELDFGTWQSWVVLGLLVTVFAFALISALLSLGVMFWWIAGDMIENRNKMRESRRRK